jgi:thiopeptide-type bacteriocin biosynthesis protein
VLRGYEIPYLGKSGAPAERQLPLDDLRVSIPGDAGVKIVLRSARLDREVLPRLTSAHNHVGADLAIYRFLCALQTQRCRGGLAWSWGTLARARRLPRVTRGRLVLALAQWTLAKRDVDTLAKDTDVARFRAAAALREAYGLPRWISVVEGDNVLPIDLESTLSVDTFAQLVKGRGDVVVVEMFPSAEELAVEGPEGRFTHEVVLPFVRAEGPAATLGEGAPVSRETGPCSFTPGSEWLYARLLTGTLTSDAVLADVVRPVVDQALASGAADGWYFIRYTDPHWQVRFRLHGDPRRLAGEVLPHLHERLRPFLQDGRVWKVTLETYEREVERYGGEHGIPLAERVFHADSEAVLAIVEQLSGDEGAEARWRLAVRGTDALLGDLGLDLAARRRVIAGLREAFGARHNVDVRFERQLGAKFRKERAGLEALLALGPDADDPLAPGIEAFAKRSEAMAPIVAELRREEERGRLTVGVEGLASSFAHMFINRLLRSEHLAQELVIYDFLQRIYEGYAARARR